MKQKILNKVHENVYDLNDAHWTALGNFRDNKQLNISKFEIFVNENRKYLEKVISSMTGDNNEIQIPNNISLTEFKKQFPALFRDTYSMDTKSNMYHSLSIHCCIGLLYGIWRDPKKENDVLSSLVDSICKLNQEFIARNTYAREIIGIFSKGFR